MKCAMLIIPFLFSEGFCNAMELEKKERAATVWQTNRQPLRTNSLAIVGKTSLSAYRGANSISGIPAENSLSETTNQNNDNDDQDKFKKSSSNPGYQVSTNARYSELSSSSNGFAGYKREAGKSFLETGDLKKRFRMSATAPQLSAETRFRSIILDGGVSPKQRQPSILFTGELSKMYAIQESEMGLLEAAPESEFHASKK